jgi:hypothetical protein
MNDMPARPHAEIAALRWGLWEGGFRPVALKTGDKMPMVREWTERARRSPPADADDPPRSDLLNTGILADGLRIIDVDIDDYSVASTIRTLALVMLGSNALIRTRENVGRCALVYRAESGEPPKRTLTALRARSKFSDAGSNSSPSGGTLLAAA